MVQTSIQVHGKLFEDVQKSRIFKDSKTFVDSCPNKSSDEILTLYEEESAKENFSLKEFVLKHFTLPVDEELNLDGEYKIEIYITKLWDLLLRDFSKAEESSSLLKLPNKHLVPGGRFRECYYWDSYFVIEGLFIENRIDIIKNMVDNFAHLLNRYGFIPNGNRSYYLTRSQQPYFSLILAALYREGHQKYALSYFEELLKEHEYWTRGADLLSDEKVCSHHAVYVDGAFLNRYYDESNAPRQESYIEDVKVHNLAKEKYKGEIYRNLRAACESGWDFSSRWLENEEDLSTIVTTEILPVDLNCLIYHMEYIIYRFADELERSEASHFKKLSEKRKESIQKYFYCKEKKFYFDYHYTKGCQTKVYSLAAVFPLFMEIATEEQAKEVAEFLEEHMLHKGGLVTTTKQSNQQWDFPNGWAPLQFMAFVGLKNYGYTDLAAKVAEGFVLSCERAYNQTGKLLEKYHMPTASSKAVDGEYDLQEGFGWTNGVVKIFQSELSS
ncbi:MAG: Periplasmic trehalase [Chlamydiia bacterium]|nr:Periplasmic trehalase [Chlamydiia bacterium]